MSTTVQGYSAETQKVIDQNREFSLFSWKVQGDVKPPPIEKAQGVYFWDLDGKRYLDFSSQLMNVNLGHGHPKVIEAIQKQVAELSFVYPGLASRARGEAAQLLAEVTPGDLTKSFFTLGGADAIENAMKIARLYTGRQKVLTRYRSYHGATFGAMSAGGDPRRLANEPGVPWIVRMFDPYSYRSPLYRHCSPEEGDLVLADLVEEQVLLEGPENVAAILLEGYSGSSGIIAPHSRAYWQKIRELCTRHGILLIVDEVMSGFGRTGRWFGIDHYDIVPDIMVCAKGLTAGYIPLGATVVSEAIGHHFETNPLWCGLTYSSHPVGCAAAAACIKVYQEEKLVERAAAMGERLESHLTDLQSRHRCLGEFRGIGLFYVLELIKNRETREPMSPWNQALSEPMAKVASLFQQRGLSTFVRWNWIFCVPPLCISEQELAEGLEIIDEALTIVDAYGEE